MKPIQCHPQSYGQSPSTKRKQEGWNRRTLVLASVAWLDKLESWSSVIIWHPLNIVSEKERGETYDDNLLHIALLPIQQKAYRQTEQQEALFQFYLQLISPGRKIFLLEVKSLHKVAVTLHLKLRNQASQKHSISREGKKRWFCKI